MSYTHLQENLRGGGGCCKNKNKNQNQNQNRSRSFARNPVHDFSTLNNDFSEELEDYQCNKADELQQGCCNVMQDDDAMLTEEYESMNRDYRDDRNNEEDDFLDQYLLSMSPIIDKRTRNRGEKGKKGLTTQRTVPRRPHDVSVKCSDSTEEIVGTPSEVALQLNEAIQNYLPRRKMRIEEEVSKEAAVTLDGEYQGEPDDESAGNLCRDEPECISEPRGGCPGTYDRLGRKNVPCAEAMTLREIALGRRIKRPQYTLPIEDQYEMSQFTQPIATENEKGGCCCSKKKKRDGRGNSPLPAKSCCTKQNRNNKSVSFSF